MEKYIIYKNEGTTSRKYLQTIYRSSTSESSDIGNAIEFPNKELAIETCNYINDREVEKFKVLCIKTTIEEDIQ